MNEAKNPQAIQAFCIPVVCSFLQSDRDFDLLPTTLKNLIHQCSREIGATINEAPLATDIPQPNKDPRVGPGGPPVVTKPCVGCQ